ncbi:MAG: SHOCT domain-containing protein [Thermodesulfobacteriota bacterium]
MMPFFVIILIVAVLYLLFGRRGGQGQESALDILKKRYARGEISKEEFEQIKKDLTA